MSQLHTLTNEHKYPNAPLSQNMFIIPEFYFILPVLLLPQKITCILTHIKLILSVLRIYMRQHKVQSYFLVSFIQHIFLSCSSVSLLVELVCIIFFLAALFCLHSFLACSVVPGFWLLVQKVVGSFEHKSFCEYNVLSPRRDCQVQNWCKYGAYMLQYFSKMVVAFHDYLRKVGEFGFPHLGKFLMFLIF